MFALMFDGFVQDGRFDNLESAKAVWMEAVKNQFLYEYDCAIVEVNDSGMMIRRLSYQELTK